jgi:hypothetical protein
VETTARELRRLRLANQWIDPIGAADVADTVRHLVAMQAQDFKQALWAVGRRSPGATRTDVLGALARGEVVRSLPMRGTLHFVASEDLRWILALTSERTVQSAAPRFERIGLDRATLDRAADVTRDALAGGRSLDRVEFMALLAANGIEPAGQRGYHLIFHLCQRALICWGPPSGTQQALVLVDEWIPPTPERDRAEAIQTFALRYFASHGPATERDFAWWTKLKLREVRAAVAGLGDRLTTLTADGVDYLVATSAFEAVPVPSKRSGTLALPGFDEYLLGYQDRELALEAEHAWRIVPGNNGMFLPMIVADGRIVGGWRRHPKTRRAEPDHFVAATPAQLAGFDRAAKLYERFMAG